MFMKIAVAFAVVALTATGSVAATKKQHSPNPRWDVYDGRGTYLGSDPDPTIRQKILVDRGYN